MADTNGRALMLDPRRNQSAERMKLYEEMLLKEIPGTNRPNEPMHAVLESELGESEMTERCEAQNVRNHALIHYLATLASSNNTKDTFDFDFVESLLRNGADVNSMDKTGQTVFHEVARSWNIDVATFLIKNGANVNHQDQFGRSPLHVAAAVDYAEMVEFLLQNGADINIKTHGEGQAPVHFAAKNDAINSLKMLLGYGADIDARDSKNRTPLQVSAEMNRSKAAKLLINEGAPAGVHDNLGNSALALLIEKIPEVALEAMDQFHSTDTINRKEFYFLNYLEGTKLKDQKTPARTPLEIAVQNERFDIILHPVMQRLIGVKWQMYGKWGAVQDLVLNLVYTILWTAIGVTLPKYGRDLYLPIRENVWRLTIGVLLILLTFVEIRKQVTNTIKTRRELKKWREWRAAELERDIQYCHPRWPQETQYLKSEIKAVRNLSLISASDWWIYFDWVALVLILATIISHATFFHFNSSTSQEVHHYIMIALLLILWFRIFKYARPFEGAGPFVVIFGSVFGDIIKWGFLNSIIIVPYTCAFWITFGAISLNPVEGYDTVGPLLYNMFSMMVVGDHGYDRLEKASPIMARLLCGSFIGIAAIVTLNLLIALLSNTFERLYENAVANAVMQRARTILLLQKSLRRKQKKRYYNFIKNKGSPEVIRNDLGRLSVTDHDEHTTLERVREDIKIIMSILGERFGKRYGKGKKSDIDFVKMDVSKLKRFQEELVNDVKNMKMVLQGITETLETLRENINNTNNNNSENNDQNNNNVDNVANNINSVSIPASPSATLQLSPNLKPAPDQKATVRTHKLGKKSESSSEDDSDTDDSNSSLDGSRSFSTRRKRHSKAFGSHNRQRKKSSHQGRLKCIDQGGDMGNKEKFIPNLPYPSAGQSTSQRFSNDMMGKGLNPVRLHLAYPPGSSQPNLPGFWPNKGISAGMSGQTYPPKFTQTSPNYTAFRPVYEPQSQRMSSGYLAQQDLQQEAHSKNLNRTFLKNRNAFAFTNPLQRPLIDAGALEREQGFHRGSGFENTQITGQSNIQPSTYDIQTRRTEDRGPANASINQPMYRSAQNTVIYPRQARGFRESAVVENIRRPAEMQNFQKSSAVQNYGFERDGERLNQFSPQKYPPERFVYDQSGFVNESYKQTTDKASAPSSSVSGENHFSSRMMERNGDQYISDPGGQKSQQTRDMISHSNSDSRLQHFYHAQPDAQSYAPQSMVSHLSETNQQKEFLQEGTSSPHLNDQATDVQPSDNHFNEMVSLQIPVTNVPRGTPLQDQTRGIQQQEDCDSSRNQPLEISPKSNDLQENPSKREPRLPDSRELALPLVLQNQFPVNNMTAENEADPLIVSRVQTPIAPEIMEKVVFFEEKMNGTETGRQEYQATVFQEGTQDALLLVTEGHLQNGSDGNGQSSTETSQGLADDSPTITLSEQRTLANEIPDEDA